MIGKLDKKIILAGNIINARKYVINEANLGNSFYNYQEHNMLSLVNMLLDDNIRIISDKESSYIIYNLIKDNYDKYIKKDNKDIYKRETFTIKAVSKLLEIINDARLSLSGDVTSLFDIEYNILLDDYKEYLNNHNLTDYIYALDLIKNKKSDAILLILDDVILSKKEELILKDVFKDIKYITPTKHESNIISSSPCYGIYNEILNVLDIIKNNNYSINECEILYTSNVYENLLRATLDSFNIKYSITGAHAKTLNIISFMLDILNYVKNEYVYEELEDVLKNNGLQDVYLAEFYKTLDIRKTNFNVGFTYKRTKEFAGKLDKVSGVENIKMFLNDLTSFGDVNDFNYKEFRLFVYKYLNNGRELNVIKNKIDNLEHIIDLSDNKINTLIDELEALRYTESVSNTLQISLLNKSFSLKKYLFIIGLSQSYVVGADTENPFIKDINKYKEILGNQKYLHIVDNLKNKNVEALDYYINYSNSLIYLSYSYFDKIEFKPSSPSVFYIKRGGNVFNGNNGINLYQIDDKQIKFGKIETNDSPSFDHNYDNGQINELIDAKAHQDNEKVEVVVKKNSEVYDYHLSPSALQTLIDCPFKYYYEKIVHLPNPSYPSMNVSSWLDANAKGTFFHEVLELYGNETKFKGKFNNEVFEKVFEKALHNALELNPIKNKNIAKKEINDVKTLASIKIEKIINDYKETGYNLLGCEYDLANTGYKYKNIAFSGFIDRVDGKVLGDTLHIRVVDYKTGKYNDKKNSHYLQHVIYPVCLKNDINKFAGFKYDDVVVDEFIYDYVFDNNQNEYNAKEIDEETNKIFSSIDYLLTNYLDNGKCYSEFESFFDNKELKTTTNLDRTFCGYCKNYKTVCYKRLKEGVEWAK